MSYCVDGKGEWVLWVLVESDGSGVERKCMMAFIWWNVGEIVNVEGNGCLSIISI